MNRWHVFESMSVKRFAHIFKEPTADGHYQVIFDANIIDTIIILELVFSRLPFIFCTSTAQKAE